MAIAETEIQTKIKPGMEITEDELMRLPNDRDRPLFQGDCEFI